MLSLYVISPECTGDLVSLSRGLTILEWYAMDVHEIW